jgi:hypothetical protein
VNRAHTDQASAALAEKAQRLRASLVTKSKHAHGKQKLASALEPLAPAVARGAEEVRSWLAETAAPGIGPDEKGTRPMRSMRSRASADRRVASAMRAPDHVSREPCPSDRPLSFHQAGLPKAVL